SHGVRRRLRRGRGGIHHAQADDQGRQALRPPAAARRLLGDGADEMRSLGRTRLRVSPLGVGCGPMGGASVDGRDAHGLVDAPLSLDLTVFDTAPSYGESEARLGRALAGRRDGVVIVTKCGYGVPGVDDWTPECIARGVDRTLERLRTDR